MATTKKQPSGVDDIKRHNEGTGDQGPWDVYPSDKQGKDVTPAGTSRDPSRPSARSKSTSRASGRRR